MPYPKKTIYYTDPSHDFVGDGESTPLCRGYRYINDSPWARFGSTVLYRGIATPIAFLHNKLFLCERIVGREILPREGGYFLFLNHTETVGDAFTPSLAAFPRRVYVVVHPDNLSWGAVAELTPALGALPLPSDRCAAREFGAAIRRRLSEGGVIAVYPEAHVWPKCSFIRPFEDGAFDLARMFGAPVYTATRVYRKSALGYRTVVYIDGPFEFDSSLGRREGRDRLCREVRDTMEKRSASGDVEVYRYERRESDE